MIKIYIDGQTIEFPEIISDDDNTFSYRLLKRLIKEANSNLSKVVQTLNEQNPEKKSSPQNLSNKLSNDTLRVKEFFKIIENLGYSVSFNRRNGDDTTPDNNDVYELVKSGYASCKGVHFPTILIVGKRASEAAKKYEVFLNQNTKDSNIKLKDEITIVGETALMVKINELYDVKCFPVDKDNALYDIN